MIHLEVLEELDLYHKKYDKEKIFKYSPDSNYFIHEILVTLKNGHNYINTRDERYPILDYIHEHKLSKKLVVMFGINLRLTSSECIDMLYLINNHFKPCESEDEIFLRTSRSINSFRKFAKLALLSLYGEDCPQYLPLLIHCLFFRRERLHVPKELYEETCHLQLVKEHDLRSIIRFTYCVEKRSPYSLYFNVMTRNDQTNVIVEQGAWLYGQMSLTNYEGTLSQEQINVIREQGASMFEQTKSNRLTTLYSAVSKLDDPYNSYEANQKKVGVLLLQKLPKELVFIIFSYVETIDHVAEQYGMMIPTNMKNYSQKYTCFINRILNYLLCRKLYSEEYIAQFKEMLVSESQRFSKVIQYFDRASDQQLMKMLNMKEFVTRTDLFLKIKNWD